jgi:endonuclease/exonuclease/phosphatase family metal-dependent hydrolase
MVKLVCYNIEYCEGMLGLWYEYLQFWKLFFPKKNIDKEIIKALNHLNLDVLALVEVDTGSFRSQKDEAVFFERKLKMRYLVEKVKYSFTAWLNLFRYIPILNKQANAIVSKYKLINIKYHKLNEGIKRIVIESSIMCPKKVTLLLAHLALGKETRARQIEELIGIVNEIKNPVILMGDFNTFNGMEEIYKLLKKTHLEDKYKLDKYSTRLTQPSCNPKKRLDYVLVSSQIRVKKYEVLNYHFSDHMPIFMEFYIK